MASPYRRPGWARRQWRAHPTLFVVGIVCAVAVLVEIGAVTDFFGLARPHPASTPAGPNLNPGHETVVAIDVAFNYTGASKGYFTTGGTDLCDGRCPLLFQPNGTGGNVYGVVFFYNITNLKTVQELIETPVLNASGPSPEFFHVVTKCCWTATNVLYDEALDGPTTFLPSQTIGFLGYAYATEEIPGTASGGYTLYYNITTP